MFRYWTVLVFVFFCNVALCRDFYMGMFRKNDFLMAQDRLYKEKVPYRRAVAMYGKVFRCPITYVRVTDRLGIGRGPKVEVHRGGLRQKHIVLRIYSVYNMPISVNIYIGCEHITTTTTDTTTTTGGGQAGGGGGDGPPPPPPPPGDARF